MNPRDPSPFIVRAKAQHEQGNDIEAIEDLSVVINKSSRHASAYNSRAWSELVLGRFKQALQDANAAVELDSEMAEARDTRGVVLFCLKKYDGALADFAQSIALKPQDGASYFHRALIYDVTGKLQKAALDRDKAKGLGYTPEPWEVKIQSNK